MYSTYISDAISSWNISLSADKVSALSSYLEKLSERNNYIDLTSITDPIEMTLRHVMDPLSFVKLGLLKSGTLLDVGSGGGTPGIPLAIAVDHLLVTLNEPMQKRCDFLEFATKDLPNVSILRGRAEDLARGLLRESFDYLTARAVAPLNTLAELCLPYLRVGGYFLPMKGRNIQEELDEAENAIALLGGVLEDIKYYSIPNEDINRSILVIRKARQTDQIYPRRTAKMKRNPL